MRIPCQKMPGRSSSLVAPRPDFSDSTAISTKTVRQYSVRAWLVRKCLVNKNACQNMPCQKDALLKTMPGQKMPGQKDAWLERCLVRRYLVARCFSKHTCGKMLRCQSFGFKLRTNSISFAGIAPRCRLPHNTDLHCRGIFEGLDIKFDECIEKNTWRQSSTKCGSAEPGAHADNACNHVICRQIHKMRLQIDDR